MKTRVIHDASSGSGHLGRMSIAQLIKHTVRQDGVLALWRGVTPVICKQGTNSAVRFTTFGALKDKLQGSYSGVLTPATATMIAGAGSGVITV